MAITDHGSGSFSSVRRSSWAWSVWAVVVFLSLAVGWERFAAGYTAGSRGLVHSDAAFLRAGNDLALTLHELPPPAAPRLAVFGSSQIATVKGGSGQLDLSMPARLSVALTKRGVAHEIVDFSTGGQQVSESMVILLAAGEQAQLRAVVLGLSLFSMLRVEVRETLLEAANVPELREAVIAGLPSDLPHEDVEELLEFSRRAPQRVAGRGETTQQRIDRWLGKRLEARFAAVANRQVLYDELVDTPLRRDLVAFVKRNLAASRTARSYRIGRSYRPSLAALEVMARWCRQRRVALHVALLPFDHDRSPVPFDAATIDRLRTDLAALATEHGFQLTDQSDLLASSNFGNYVDGSPDNLHFDADGHDRLGRALAVLVAPDLERSVAARAR